MDFVRVGSGKTWELVWCYRAVGAVVAWNEILVMKYYSYCCSERGKRHILELKLELFSVRLV